MSISPIRPQPALPPDWKQSASQTHDAKGSSSAHATRAPVAQHPARQIPFWAGSRDDSHFQTLASHQENIRAAIAARAAQGGMQPASRPQTSMRSLRRIYQLMKGPLAEGELADRADTIIEALQNGEDLEQFFGEEDATAHYIALQEAAEKLRATENNEVREKIEAQLKRLRRLQRQRILSDINTAHAIASFTKDLSEREQLRRFYYDSIVSCMSLRETFERLLQSFTASKFSWALAVLRKAIKDDISARTSIADRIRLEMGSHTLNQVSTINSMTSYARDLGSKLDSPALKEAGGVYDFMREVMRYMESAGGTKRFAALCEGITSPERADSPEVQRHVRLFLREEVPLILWPDRMTRETHTNPYFRPAASSTKP